MHVESFEEPMFEPEDVAWTATIELDPNTGEGVVTIPFEILDYLGWYEGINLSMEVQDNGLVVVSSSDNEWSDVQ